MLLTILHHYLLWHYLKAWGEIWHVGRNLLWFLINFFSLPQLAKSLFSPWRRITEERHESFSFDDIAGYIVINIISRLIGCLIRLVVIIVGLIALLCLTASLIVVFVCWAIAPAALFISLYIGVSLLI